MVREEEEEGAGAQEHEVRNRLFFCLALLIRGVAL
jgi:hypothetical protein